MRGFRSPGDKRPLVLLLGWLGSKHQHLNKYTRMWQVRDELSWLPPSSVRAAVLCFVSCVARNLPAVAPCCCSWRLHVAAVVQPLALAWWAAARGCASHQRQRDPPLLLCRTWGHRSYRTSHPYCRCVPVGCAPGTSPQGARKPVSCMMYVCCLASGDVACHDAPPPPHTPTDSCGLGTHTLCCAAAF